ncbi:MAG: hypothetical protein FJW95_01145 [Actinobacteria bacterium]|nr:hypothetical protein [Actinomycetota bacterium]
MSVGAPDPGADPQGRSTGGPEGHSAGHPEDQPTDHPGVGAVGTATGGRADGPRPRQTPVRAAWGVAYRTTTMLGAALLAALAFAQDTLVWDLVGAVLVAFAIVDLILLVAVTWFQWRHRDD